ncbi:MAG: hypothetical protein M9938_11495 [Solirubrobacterales bacterium]|nr:hypothetical protein [Solirubrobacterales bacterium]
MNIGGTLVSSVVRIVVVVATIAATYYFIIRPILDTTEKVSTGISGNVQKTLDDAFSQSGISTHRQTVITRQIKSANGRDIKRLNRCVTRAGTNMDRINRCVARFTP